MIRWKGLIFLAVLIGIFLLISFIFTDRWLEKNLEELGTSVAGAKVEIDNLDFSFLGPHLKWNRLQVTDPKDTWKNMFETGQVDFDMEFWPLLSKKVIIEAIEITDIRTNTERETDGKLLTEEEEGISSEPGFITKTVDNLQEKVSSATTKQFDSYKQKVNVDSIMKMLDLHSITRIDSLNKSLQEKFQGWEKKLSDVDIQKDLKRMETKVKSIKTDKIKSPADFQAALNNVNQIKSTLDSLNKFVNVTKTDLNGDLKIFSGSLKDVNKWIQDDYKQALSLAKLPDLSVQNVGKLVFGKKLIGEVNKYLGYVGTARQYSAKLKSDKPEKEEPPRLKGQNIYFYNQNARPDFWIQRINLTGETNNNVKLAGLVENIVSDQRQIGKTTDIAIEGSSEKGAALNFTGQLNYLEEVNSENFFLKYSGFSLAHTKLSDSPLLPNELEKGRGSIESNLNLTGDQIEAKIVFVGDRLVIDYSKGSSPKNKFEEIVRSIVKSIDKIDFTAKIKGKKDDLSFSLNSNLDNMIASKMKAIVSGEIEKAKKEIKKKIDREVDKYKKEVENLISDKKASLLAEAKKYEDMVKEKSKLLEDKKKDIENQINKQKSKLEDEAKKKLKDIFKF